MPINEFILARTAKKNSGGVLISEDQSCVQCGYNLKGLMSGGRCPECGAPIRRIAGRGTRRDTLGDAPSLYLFGLGLGLIFLALTLIVRLVEAVTGGFPPNAADVVQYSARGAICLLWYAGVLLVLRQRPLPPGVAAGSARDIDALGREWFALRATIALMQLAVFTGAGAYILWDRSALRVWWAVWIGSEAVVAAGWAPLCFYLARLAEWAPHDGLALHLRNTGSGIVLAALVFGVLSLSSLLLSGLPALQLARFMLGVLMAAYPFLVGYLAFLLCCMTVMAGWARINYHQRVARDERMAARAAQEVADLPVATGTMEDALPGFGDEPAHAAAESGDSARAASEKTEPAAAPPVPRQAFAGERDLKTKAEVNPYSLEGE